MNEIQSKSIIECLKSDAYISKIREVLTKDDELNRFLILAKIEISKNPRLNNCRPSTILSCLISAASAGVYIDSGEAYLIPYGETCQLQIGYKGMIKLMHSCGVTNIKAKNVYQNDLCEILYSDESDQVTHIPNLADRGEIIGVYAIAQISSETIVEYMSKKEIDQARRCARDSSRGPWVDFYGEMAKKTVIKRLFKLLPHNAININALQLLKNEDNNFEKSNKNIGSSKSAEIANLI